MRAQMMTSLLRGFFSAVLLCFVATSQAAETGFLWKAVAPSGKVSYLLGTMHTDDARATEFSSPIQQAFDSSDVFMMETLPTQDVSIYRMRGKTLRDLLSEDELDQVRKLADFHAMHTDVAMQMKPWLLAVVFDLPKPQAMFSMDEELLSKAQQQDKEILGLEDSEEHFATLDSFSIDDQIVMLRAVLKRTQEEKERNFEALINAYQAGDLDKIAALDDKITGNILPKELWQRMRSKLIDERNVLMAERIVNEANDNSAFIAVGASHLAGNDGLIARLRAAGYKVTVLKN